MRSVYRVNIICVHAIVSSDVTTSVTTILRKTTLNVIWVIRAHTLKANSDEHTREHGSVHHPKETPTATISSIEKAAKKWQTGPFTFWFRSTRVPVQPNRITLKAFCGQSLRLILLTQRGIGLLLQENLMIYFISLKKYSINIEM